MSATVADTQPYLGLRYFEERDADLFYGRDEHVAELLGQLAANRFVAVMGSSGSGKSSLVRAGLLPELRSGMIPKAGTRWKVVEFKPGNRPLGELSDAIRSALGVAQAQELVEEGPLGIARAVAEADLEPGTNTLVIADQFEEVFRFQREESRQNRGPEAAEQCQAMVRRLLDAAAQPELPIYVLLVMRSDYLGECAQFPDLPERMSESLYLVPRLRRDQLQEAIEAPVGGRIEPAVVQRLLSEVGSDPDQLPRLQHLLGRMWDRAGVDRLTMNHYTDTGGWDGALEQHLEEVRKGLSEAQEDLCRRMFQQLSELDKGRAVRRRAENQDLERVCGAGVSEVVEKFRAEGFLLSQASPVDITHECVLRGWKRLREWLLDEERGRVFYRELVDRKDRAGRLHGSDLREVSRQRRAGRCNIDWALRYGTAEEFAGVEDYVRKSRVRRLAAQIGVGGLIIALALLGVYTVWSSGKQERRARARELTAYAALSQSVDPTTSLYLGYRTAQTAHWPPGLEEVLRTALANGPSYVVLRGHDEEVRSVAWSPDGKAVASLSGHQIRLWDSVTGQLFQTLRSEDLFGSVAWSPDGRTVVSLSGHQIRLWDPATGQLLRTLRGEDLFHSVAWSPDGKTLASSNGRRTTIWEVTRGQAIRTLDAPGHMLVIAWSPDGKILASANDDDAIQLWQPSTGELLQTLEGPEEVQSVAWSPDGTMLASSGRDVVRLWRAAGSGLTRVREGRCADLESQTEVDSPCWVTSVAWSPDGKTLAFATFRVDNDTLQTLYTSVLWEAASGRVLRTVQDLLGESGAAWSPHGTILAVAGGRGIPLWDASRGQPLRTLQGHQDAVTSVAWSPAGNVLASTSVDGTVRLWNMANTIEEAAYAVAWSPDGKTLASAGVHTIRLWQMNSCQLLRTLEGHKGDVRDVAWSSDGRTLASASSDKTVRLWEPASGQPLAKLEGHEGSVNSVAWSPDGKTLASASSDKTVRLWEAVSGQLLRTLEGHTLSVWSLAWSPDGRTLASAAADFTVRLWDATSGQALDTLQGHEGDVRDVGWSPDGKTLASASVKTIRLWEPASGQPFRTLEGHEDIVRAVAWSPSGNLLASASEDGIIRLWDAAKLQPPRTLEGHTLSAWSLAWSPDGKTLASAGYDKTIRLWPGTADGLLEHVRDRIRLFSLTPEDCQRYFESQSCPPVR